MARACRDSVRSESDGELVCVSKGHGSDAILPLLEAGQRIFGENRVQEAAEKWPALRDQFGAIELHLIGPLQTNKATDAVALFDVIQTVDRPKIAVAIAEAISRIRKAPRLFIQVNTGREIQKAGVAPAELGRLLAFCRNEAKLNIEGLMCIPPRDELASPHFAFLARLAAEFDLRQLSMGMSEDFELALQLGATYVRVGSAIFGKRRNG
jgi:pyridoxal phosphate enzyme (YggS family)